MAPRHEVSSRATSWAQIVPHLRYQPRNIVTRHFAGRQDHDADMTRSIVIVASVVWRLKISACEGFSSENPPIGRVVLLSRFSGEVFVIFSGDRSLQAPQITHGLPQLVVDLVGG